MKVYVLVRGLYDNTDIVGVFADEEGALAAHAPVKKNTVSHSGRPYTYEWKRDDKTGRWMFDADWWDFAEILDFEVQGTSADLTQEFVTRD